MTFELVFMLAGYIAIFAILIALIRLVRGPRPADRVVALDVMTIVSISVIAFGAVFFGRIIYLDVALVYGLISFVGIVAIARYIEGGL
jgi:multicomponent Na+:H+ antiporter subunit F